jgi:tetratricopeptide (TPR) repeat protein
MKRPRVPLLDSLKSAQLLLENQRQTLALDLVEKAITNVQTQTQWQEIRAFLTQGFEASTQWKILFSQALMGTRDDQRLMEFTKDLHLIDKTTAPVLLQRAWALLQQNQYQIAFDLLNQIIPFLTDSSLGMAHKRRGLAMFHLNLEWDKEFHKALELLTKRPLGLMMIDHAWCYQQTNQLEKARDLLTKALPKLRGDHYHLAWARYNLGEIAIQEMNPDAERHYTLAEEFSRYSDAKHFRSRALQGIAKWRRYNKDFIRSEAAYRSAIGYATENNDQRAAYWSLGRTLRLTERNHEALEMLEAARQLETTPGIEIETAACYIALAKLEIAKQHLNQKPSEPYQSIALILKAEIARIEKNGSMAFTYIQQVNFSSLNAKEEIGHWKNLAQLATLAGLELPEFQAAKPNTVEVRACGILQVFVNQSAIRLNPTGRVGELLVLLLELGNHTHVEQLIEKMYPAERIAKNKKGAIWDLVKRLRLALGWQGSLLVTGNTIRLDPSTAWQYDVNIAREQQKASGFLEGIHSNWVQDVAQELAALELMDSRERLLN